MNPPPDSYFERGLALLEAGDYRGGGRLHDKHSETQGYLLILRVWRLLWRVLRLGRRG